MNMDNASQKSSSPNTTQNSPDPIGNQAGSVTPSAQSGQPQAGEHTLVQFPKSQPSGVQTSSQPSPVTSQPIPTEPAAPIPSATPTSSQMPQSVPLQEEISTGKFKESAPMSPVVNTAEYIAPSETPVNLESSIEKTGVKEISHMPQLRDDHKQAGLREAKEAIPVGPIVNASTSNIKLPMDKQKAQSVVKGPAFLKKASSSMVWLAYLILKNYQYLEKKEKEEKNKK